MVMVFIDCVCINKHLIWGRWCRNTPPFHQNLWVFSADFLLTHLIWVSSTLKPLLLFLKRDPEALIIVMQNKWKSWNCLQHSGATELPVAGIRAIGEPAQDCSPGAASCLHLPAQLWIAHLFPGLWTVTDGHHILGIYLNLDCNLKGAVHHLVLLETL